MYQGFYSAPPLLHPFMDTDGEGSYNRTLYEMFMVTFLAILGFAATWGFYFHQRPKPDPVGVINSESLRSSP